MKSRKQGPPFIGRPVFGGGPAGSPACPLKVHGLDRSNAKREKIYSRVSELVNEEKKHRYQNEGAMGANYRKIAPESDLQSNTMIEFEKQIQDLLNELKKLVTREFDTRKVRNPWRHAIRAKSCVATRWQRALDVSGCPEGGRSSCGGIRPGGYSPASPKPVKTPPDAAFFRWATTLQYLVPKNPTARRVTGTLECTVS